MLTKNKHKTEQAGVERMWYRNWYACYTLNKNNVIKGKVLDPLTPYFTKTLTTFFAKCKQ